MHLKARSREHDHKYNQSCFDAHVF
jgi:hypothetical protein